LLLYLVSLLVQKLIEEPSLNRMKLSFTHANYREFSSGLRIGKA